MRNHRGFTLIELLIVVAIVAILAAIAVPAYNSQVRKSQRAEARSALQQIMLLQEKFRADNPQYGATLGPGAGNDIRASTTSENGLWTIRLSNASANGYTLTATKSGGLSDSTCGGGMTITVNNASTTPVVKAPAPCW